METVYRDYGAMGPANSTNQLIAPANEFNIDRRRQVYQATHRGDGSRLPFMNRSFISFTYGGKPIEDFDLIATITNNRLNKDGYAGFDDIVTTYDNLDGQFYWNTHYKNNSLIFVLSTDGIDQKTLDDFLYWFHAGEAKELILSEHPNRAIMARVAKPPQLSLLPFGNLTTIVIAGQSYNTKTTLYKGDITLEMVMDEPHWYAKQNILGIKDGNYYLDDWKDPNGNTVDIFASQDALKILLEDGIPLGTMIDNNMLLGDGAFANVEGNAESLIWSLVDEEIVWTDDEPSGEGARIDGTDNGKTYRGRIAGAIVDITGDGILSLRKDVPAYFYYAGTAPAPTIITFNLPLSFNSQGLMNSINEPQVNSTVFYNEFTIESRTRQTLKLSAPSIITNYNKALLILREDYVSGASIATIRDKIMTQIKHPAVRAWVNSLLGTGTTASSVSRTAISTCMKNFFTNYSSAMMQLSFNSKTGEATCNINYRKPTSQLDFNLEEANIVSYSQNIEAIEDISDALYSNNIIIRDRNYPNEVGKIMKWENTEIGRTYSHKITHDFSQPIENLQIYYRNMYL